MATKYQEQIKGHKEGCKQKKQPASTGGGLFWRNFALFMLPILKLGFKQQVQLEDLNETWQEDGARELGDRVWSRYKPRRSKSWPSLHNAMLVAFRRELATMAILGILNAVIATPIRSLLLSWLVRDSSLLLAEEFNKLDNNIASAGTTSSSSTSNTSTSANDTVSSYNDTEQLKQTLALHAAALLFLSWFIGPLTGLYLFWQDRAGMRCRVAASQLVYEKSLRLSQQALSGGQSSVGQMVNLLSNDVTRMEKLVCVSELLILPLEVAVALVILVNYLGFIPTLACAMSILGYLVVQTLISKAFSRFRARIATCTDKRVQLMHEFVLAIQTIKLYSWEKPLEVEIELARKTELQAIGVSRLFRTLFGTLTASSAQFFMFVAILSRLLVGDSLKPDVLFLTMELVRNLGVSLTVFYPEAVSSYAELVVACRRCDDFLDLPETNLSQANYCKAGTLRVGDKSAIQMHNVTCCRTNSTSAPEASKARPILKQLSFSVNQGQLLPVGGRVGSGKSSLLLAIAGELPISTGRILVNGSISYSCQEAWIFAGTIRDNVLFGLGLNEPRYSEVLRVCALEQDLASLPAGDLTLAGERGAQLSGGQKARVNLARALYRQADIYLLDDPLSAVDAPIAKHIFKEAIQGFLKDKTVVLATHQLSHFEATCMILILDQEGASAGLVTGQNREEASTATISDDGDNKIASSDAKLQVEDKKSLEIVKFEETTQDATLGGETGGAESTSSSYMIYLRNAVSPLGAILVLLACISSELIFQSTDFFLTNWAESYELKQFSTGLDSRPLDASDVGRFNQNYAALLMLGILMAMLRIACFYWAAQIASRNLHRKLLACIVRAPMQFFDSYPMGTILNRFSRDLGLIDEQIPLCMTELVAVRSVAIAGSLVTTIVIAPSSAIPNCLTLLGLVVICWTSLKTVVRLRELDNNTKSDVFSHLSTSVAGLATIRSFGRQQHCLAQFCNAQDTNTKANFAYISASSLVGSMLYLSSMIFITIEIWFNVGATSGGRFGLLVVRLFYVQAVVQWWARLLMLLEGQMASVASVARYSKLQTEQLEDDLSSSSKSSNNGESSSTTSTGPASIVFKNVSLTYSASSKVSVLQAISFTVAPGERLVVMGRTGAGKSSLVSTLLRLYPFDGSIELDGKDTKHESLSKLRKSIGVVPQRAVLFAGTVRCNLDPASKHSDAELWFALDSVMLRKFVQQSGVGLEFELHEGGSNLSHGQQQLMCLARAILRRNKIVVLDETNANVDRETEQQIKLVITRHFKGCTQIAIAHRLSTMLDCNRVLVLDKGRIVELAEPWRLAQDPASYLSKMLEGAKPDEAAELRRLLAQKAAQFEAKQM